MGDADIVIGKARVIVEAMASGRAAYVYDHNGGDGWVTSERYALLEADNFGGQAEAVAADLERLRSDLKAYRPDMGVANRQLAVDEPQREQARARARAPLPTAQPACAAGGRAAPGARATGPGADRHRPARTARCPSRRSTPGNGSTAFAWSSKRRSGHCEERAERAGRGGARARSSASSRCAAQRRVRLGLALGASRSTFSGDSSAERGRAAGRPRARRERRPPRRRADRARAAGSRTARSSAACRVLSAETRARRAAIPSRRRSRMARWCAQARSSSRERGSAPRAIVGDQAHVRERATLGADSLLGRGSALGADAVVGARVRIQTNVWLTSATVVEDDVFVGPGVVTTNDDEMEPGRPRRPAAPTGAAARLQGRRRRRPHAGRRGGRGSVRRGRRGASRATCRPRAVVMGVPARVVRQR